MWPSALLIVLATLVASAPCHAQDDSTNTQGAETGFSIWQRGWYEERGIELPRRFGVALNLISMERDIEVTGVTVQYVSNIAKYYVAYRLASRSFEAREGVSEN